MFVDFVPSMKIFKIREILIIGFYKKKKNLMGFLIFFIYNGNFLYKENNTKNSKNNNIHKIVKCSYDIFKNIRIIFYLKRL